MATYSHGDALQSCPTLLSRSTCGGQSSPRSNAKTCVTSGCQCLENLYQFKHVKSVYGAKFVRKLCWKYSDKTKYEAIKSEVNKQELFHRYSTFKASLSRNCFIFVVLNKCFEFPGNLPPLNLFNLRTRAAFDRCGRPE